MQVAAKQARQTARATDGLVGGPVLAEADAVVREDVEDTEVAEGREAHSAEHVAAKVEKGRAKGDEPAVRRNAVADAVSTTRTRSV